MLSYTISEQAVTVLLTDGLHTVANDHPKYQELITALKAHDEAEVTRLIDLTKPIKDFVQLGEDPEFTVNAGAVMYQGEPFGEAVSTKVLRMIDAGAEPQPLFNCLRKLRANPSRVAQEEALLFMLANNCLIHEDGDFIAFKGLRGDFMDVHSGTVPNKPAALLDATERTTYPMAQLGQEQNVTVAVEGERVVVTMPRYKVDDDRTRTCSFGLHVGALDFAKGFSQGRVVSVKFNPADIVSVPRDASDQKVRVCRYVILNEIEGEWQHREVYSNDDLGLDDEEDTDDLEDLDDDQPECEQCGNTAYDETAVTDRDGNVFCSDACLLKYNKS